jgi:hypothetical protein
MFLRSAFEDNKRCQQFESLTTPDSSLVSCCCYLHEATDPEGRPTVLPIHKSNVYACVISDWCSLSSQSNWNRNYPSCVSTRRFNIYFWNTCNKIVSASTSLWPSASIFGCKQLLEPRFRLPCEPESDPCQLTQDLQAACTPDSSPVSCCCFLRHEETDPGGRPTFLPYIHKSAVFVCLFQVDTAPSSQSMPNAICLGCKHTSFGLFPHVQSAFSFLQKGCKSG